MTTAPANVNIMSSFAIIRVVTILCINVKACYHCGFQLERASTGYQLYLCAVCCIRTRIPANHAGPGKCVASDHFCRCGGSPH